MKNNAASFDAALFLLIRTIRDFTINKTFKYFPISLCGLLNILKNFFVIKFWRSEPDACLGYRISIEIIPKIEFDFCFGLAYEN